MRVIKNQIATLGVSLWVGACAHAATQPPAATPAGSTPTPTTTPVVCVADAELSAADFIAKHGSVLDAYHREGGVWLEQAPVLINRDFDFALAMSLEDGLGAGLAAAKRREGNQKRAAELAELKLPAEMEARLAELRCRGTRVYFLVWGDETAAVETIRADAANAGGTKASSEQWTAAEGGSGLVERLSRGLSAAEQSPPS